MIKPLHDRVVVLPDKSPSKVSGSSILYRDDTLFEGLGAEKEKPQKGKIVALGKGRWLDSGERVGTNDLNVDDFVLFPKGSGFEITVDGTNYLLLTEKDIVATFKPIIETENNDVSITEELRKLSESGSLNT